MRPSITFLFEFKELLPVIKAMILKANKGSSESRRNFTFKLMYISPFLF